MEQSRISWSGQVNVYIGKCFRVFVNERGWKLLASSAIIVIIISWVAGSEMFVTFGSTRSGAFALICACIWIGIFNSIQSVCRERAIIKREYRTGLRLSAYITAHMVYETALCFAQAVIAVIILFILRTPPAEGIFIGSFIELLITFFLIILSADALGLLVSCIVKNETAAMTAMPFVLILQLVLAGVVFQLEGFASGLSNLTISKWGVNAICSIANVNAMQFPFFSSDFEHSAGNLIWIWFILITYTTLYGVIATFSLRLIEKDKR